MTNNSTVGKILYGVLFLIILPVVLILWAIRTDAVLTLPVWGNPGWGLFLCVFGLAMMIAGTAALLFIGKGLPMNPYPPMKFVTTGIYRYVSHPIYTGACILTIGLSVYTHSAAGLWLVSPILILACVAFVMGFENEVTHKHFPDIQYKPLISVVEPDDESPSTWNRISAYILTYIPWITLYSITTILGIQGNTRDDSGLSNSLRYLTDISTAIYLLAFIPIILAPILATKKQDLRQFMISGSMAVSVCFFIFILHPYVATIHIFHWTLFTHFPAYPPIWVLITMYLVELRFPNWKTAFRVLSTIYLISCVTAGFHLLTDVVGALIVYSFVINRVAVWRVILKIGELIANSWKEWDWGPVRMMNHGLYGGLATFTGIFMVGLFLGSNYLSSIFVVAVTTMICAALWAQFIEGSEKLLRPLGFYGGVTGVILGSWLVHLIFGTDFILIWAAFAVAAPWVQAIGRLRCLVQGCCHGRPSSSKMGIRYLHHRSRVTRLSDLGGKYIHPTPVYSILSNIIYGSILISFWLRGVSLPLILGLSFIFNGLSRFVEEAYRGEPQTPIVLGLRIYQWIALIGMILGTILTTFEDQGIHPDIVFDINLFWVAITAGVLSVFLTGIDFPRSNRRFSRLV
ncbi:MAG: prolipoprotein diacylglyceryl transferase family protein [Fidelibacterota bacterium]